MDLGLYTYLFESLCIQNFDEEEEEIRLLERKYWLRGMKPGPKSFRVSNYIYHKCVYIYADQYKYTERINLHDLEPDNIPLSLTFTNTKTHQKLVNLLIIYKIIITYILI